MAKKQAKSRHTTEQVKKGINEVLAFYAQGKQSLARCPERGSYAKGQINAEAKAGKVNPDTLRKARVFASLYDKPDLDELVRLCRKHHFAPSMSLVLRLVRVFIRQDRLKLQRKAIAGRWTTVRFDQELRARYGARRLGGRLPAIPPDKAGLLAQVEVMCETWKRWYVALKREPKPGATKATEDDFPPRLKKKVEAVLKQLADLQWSVGNELNREIPGRIPRAATGKRSAVASGMTLKDFGWIL